jgi:hypothetical protein
MEGVGSKIEGRYRAKRARVCMRRRAERGSREGEPRGDHEKESRESVRAKNESLATARARAKSKSNWGKPEQNLDSSPSHANCP